jgi:hypothetical protein
LKEPTITKTESPTSAKRSFQTDAAVFRSISSICSTLGAAEVPLRHDDGHAIAEDRLGPRETVPERTLRPGLPRFDRCIVRTRSGDRQVDELEHRREVPGRRAAPDSFLELSDESPCAGDLPDEGLLQLHLIERPEPSFGQDLTRLTGGRTGYPGTRAPSGLKPERAISSSLEIGRRGSR